MRNHKLLYVFTLAFFLLGFINIHLSILGLLCMTIPLILLAKNKKKTWCQHYCPRASLYTNVGKFVKKSRKTPVFFTKGKMKWIILTYFGFNLIVITLSTIAAASGRIPAMESLRFLFFIPVTSNLPQLINIDSIAPWITHLSYRIFSMMMTTTSLGLILAVTYKPRTWCTICPIATISDVYLEQHRKSKE